VSYFEILQLAAPEAILTFVGLAILFVDLGVMRGVEAYPRRLVAVLLTLFGCALAFMWTLAAPAVGGLGDGMLVITPLSQLVKQALLVLALFTALISLESDFTDHVGEYFALILFSAVGMMFLVSSNNLLLIFASLELTSLTLYILTAFNKRDPRSTEAALKYFLFGGMAAAFTLFGLSLLYGAAGSIELSHIATALHDRGLDPLLTAALVMTVIGFGFKVAAVPFHLWAPDAYQGAPTPSAAFIASGSKVASFVVLAKLMMAGFHGVEGSAAWRHAMPGWVSLLAVLALLSMVIGNLAALAQTSVKRLIAYSAIAHAGYALLGIMANSPQGLAALVYYVITYALTTVGAFAAVQAVEGPQGDPRLGDLAGLGRREPLVSLCLMVFILSLAGIPPLAGFFGKFYVFVAAAAVGGTHLHLLWLVIVAIAMSAVSLYYYLLVLKQVYVAPEPASGAAHAPVSATSRVVLLLLAAGVILLGCAPDLLVGRIVSALGPVTAGH
jgi:NADH-quinone oxidoreductase subunit N